jgi:hypothetical protein
VRGWRAAALQLRELAVEPLEGQGLEHGAQGGEVLGLEVAHVVDLLGAQLLDEVRAQGRVQRGAEPLLQREGAVRLLRLRL